MVLQLSQRKSRDIPPFLADHHEAKLYYQQKKVNEALNFLSAANHALYHHFIWSLAQHFLQQVRNDGFLS